ncbi:hypothetical protein BDF19DRAFT_437876 [Syncephalis fuscata]|nr:hypothetical protein BDF19DRAFT_437876 [Syncephalis fuscata]
MLDKKYFIIKEESEQFEAPLEWIQNEYRESSSRLFMSMALLSLILWTFKKAVKLVISIYRPIFILNLIQILVAVMALVSAIIHELAPMAISCTVLACINITTITIGIPCISVILLTKAYHGANQLNWIRICGFKIKYEWIITKCTIDMGFNIMLIYCFSTIIIKEAKTFQRSLRCTIVKEGLVYAACTAATNVLCVIFIICVCTAKHWEMHVYGADYCIASTLICIHLQNARKRFTKRNQEMRVVGC